MSFQSSRKPVAAQNHPLTEAYIGLVGGGLTPYDAAMRLVGPLLPLQTVQSQLFEWELDSETSERVQAATKIRSDAAIRVRELTIEKLLAVINVDIRQFFRKQPNGTITPTPITEWSKWMSSAVRKVKYTQKTDPFGNTTDTMNLDFHNPFHAIKELQELAPEVYEMIQLGDDEVINITHLEKLDDQDLQALHQRLLKAV